MNGSPTQTLRTEMRRADADSAEFRLFANHLPMVLVALDGLGAPAARLREWADTYSTGKGLVPMPPVVGAVTDADWQDAIGDRARETDLRSFFVDVVGTIGIRAALARYLPVLVDGIGASALHTLMRMAYGLVDDDPVEVGHALGYLAATYLPAPPLDLTVPDRTADPREIVRRVLGLPDVMAVTPQDLLWHTARAGFAVPDFAPVGSWLVVDDDTVPALAAVALEVFAHSRCFTSLHLVTGIHWLRVVARELDDQAVRDRLVMRVWQMMLALLPEVERPGLVDPAVAAALRASSLPCWDEIAAAAVASDDEHDVSLTFSARAEHALYGDRLHQVVAAERVGLFSR